MHKHLDVDYILKHKEFFLKESVSQGVFQLKKGSIVTFDYNSTQRWVLVIDPNWENKIHVLDLKFVPRKALLRILNEAPLGLTPRQFYEQFVHKPWVKELDAYRTYDRSKVSSYREITYNLDLQSDERDEPGIEEPLTKPTGVSVNPQGRITFNE